MLVEAGRETADAEHQGHHERRPSCSRKDDTRPPQAVTQRRHIHSHERNAKQKKNSFGNKGFEDVTDPWHRNANEHQHRQRACALTAEPS